MEQDGHYENIFKQFQNYRRDNTLCDVTIVTENEKFPVHKVLLSATSLYFNLLFTDEMKEKVQGEIFIKGVTESTVSTCLKFIYREKFDIKMNEVSDLLHAACLFQLERLKQKCIEVIQCNIDVSNCVWIYQLIQEYDCKEVEIKTKTTILQNADKLLQDDKVISDLDADTLKMMVKSEDLSVSDESVIFEALVKWIAVDEEQKKDYLCEMLEFIRLPIMNGDYFSDIVWNNNHIEKECQTCKKYFNESIQYRLGGRKRDLKDYQVKERVDYKVKNDNSIEDCFKVIVVSKSDKITSINKFNVENGGLSEYISKDQIKTNVDPLHFCIHNNALYYIDSRKILFRYEDGKWNELDKLTTTQGLYNAHLTSYKDFILAIGSYDNDSNNVFCFDVTENKWTDFPSTIEQHRSPSSVVYRDCVYVMGGFQLFLSSASVERFDANSNEWQIMPSMNKERSGHASTVFLDKIFVAGGNYHFQTLTSVETFHEGEEAWTFIQSLNIARNRFSIFVYNKKLYAFGGVRNVVSSLYETVDEESNSWKESNVYNDEVKPCRVFVT